jgi:cellulose synthase operon protein C
MSAWAGACRGAVLLGACAWAAGASGVLAADTSQDNQTIGDLVRKPPVVVPKNTSAAADAAKAMDNYKRFLELQRTDPNLRAEALRRLGDLNQDTDQLDNLDKDLSQVDLMSVEAIRLYTLLLKLYPDYVRNDQVLYQMARAYEATNKPDQALATLDQLVARYPSTRLLDEVQFRRGELLFSAKDYHGAAAAYAVVIKLGPTSGFYTQSQYKHGWSLFKQSLNEESLPSFAGVLDQELLGGVPGGPMRPLEQLSRPNRELVDDTLRVMSITASYLDGPQSIDAFLARRGTPAYAYLLYSRLGDLYVDKQRYQDAAGAYRAFVARDPVNVHAPDLAMQAIEAYTKGGFTDLVIDGKREFAANYDFSQPFWKGRAHADYPVVIKELQTDLRDLATFFHAAAQKSKLPADYSQAAHWYRSYLASFPDAPDSAATDYLLADALFESHQYSDAVTEYEHTAYGYPRDAKSAAAADAAVVSYQKAEDALTGDARSAWHSRELDADIKFAQTFPEHPDSSVVLTRAAEDIFTGHDLPRAIQVSQLLLARNPPPDMAQQRIAWNIIGQSQYELGVYDQAEAAFSQARERAQGADPATVKLRADLSERIAESVYRQGEARQKAGDANGAVADFLRVAKVAPDSKIVSTSQYDAAAGLINLKQWDQAIGVLETYRKQFPDSNAEDVTRKLAVSYVEANRPADAAPEFEHISTNATEEPAVRHEALTRAADLYEKAGNQGKTVAMLQRLVAEYPTPVPDAIEVRERLALLATKAGDTAREQQWLREIVQADAQAGAARTDRTRYLAATAQLQLAAPLRDAFADIRLVAPLKKTLVAKRHAMELALTAYKSATDYHVAAVTTAATYETAELYRKLGKDVLDSERPKKLNKDELEQYQSLLEDQAFPFEEQAIQIHEINTALAHDGVYDDWVKKSFTALAELKPGRYGKTELTPDVVTTLQVTAVPAAGAVPATATADFTQAVELTKAGKDDDAEQQFQRVAAAYPMYSGALVNLGILYRKHGELAQSEQSLQQAVMRDPADVEARSELGVTLRSEGKFHDAVTAYNDALNVDPSFAPAYRNLAIDEDLYLGDTAAALTAMEHYKQLGGDDKALTGWLADLRQRAGKNAAAPAPDATAPPPNSAPPPPNSAPPQAPDSAAPITSDKAGG